MERKLIYQHNKRRSPSENSFFQKNNKGLSGVITAMIMIGMVMAAAIIIWAVVNNILKGSEGAESCIEVFNKVKINGIYTCYDETAENVQFSLSIEGIDIDEILVSISSAGNVQSYTLTNEDQSITNLFPYIIRGTDCNDDTSCSTGETCINKNCVSPSPVKLPGKDGGKTYVVDGFSSEPDLIKIAPTINGRACDASDSLSQIESCSLSP